MESSTPSRDTAWAMSEENLEILVAFSKAFNDRDFDGALRYLDLSVEIYPGVRAPDHDWKLLGHEGWKEFIRIAIEGWDAVTADPFERIETADGRILSIDLWRTSLQGREGIEIERELPTLYSFRDGLIVRIDGFTEKARPSMRPGCRSSRFGRKAAIGFAAAGNHTGGMKL